MAEDIKKDLELEDEEGKNTDNQDNKDETEKFGSDDKSGTGSENKDDKSTGKTFTQDQVTKMMTKEKNQGRAAALRELGIDPKDTKMVAMVKALIDNQKSDDEKAAEKQSEEAAKVAEANQRALVAEAKAEAMQLGVKTQFVEDAVTLALARMTEDADLKTLIGELKTKYPVWFGDDEEDDKQADKKSKTGQKGTGSSVKSDKDKKGEEEKNLGARLAAQRKANTAKSSYWGSKK